LEGKEGGGHLGRSLLVWIVWLAAVDCAAQGGYPSSLVSCALCRQDILKSVCAAALGGRAQSAICPAAARAWGPTRDCSSWVRGGGGRGGARSPSHVRPQRWYRGAPAGRAVRLPRACARNPKPKTKTTLALTRPHTHTGVRLRAKRLRDEASVVCVVCKGQSDR
jgi:hypothetical protein